MNLLVCNSEIKKLKVRAELWAHIYHVVSVSYGVELEIICPGGCKSQLGDGSLLVQPNDIGADVAQGARGSMMRYRGNSRKALCLKHDSHT